MKLSDAGKKVISLGEAIRRLSLCIDTAVRNHLINVHGIVNPWPPSAEKIERPLCESLS